MKPVILILGGLGLGTAAAATTVATVAPAGAAHSSNYDWQDERPGPDSARVGIFLNAMNNTDPVACEMLSDQIGNSWYWGGEFGVGQLADTRTAARAGRDSLSGRVRDAGAIRLLTERLSSDDPCVRRTAARMFGRSTVSDQAIGALLDAPSPRIREAALVAVGARDPQSLRPKVERMLRDDSEAVVAMAAWALGEIEDRASVDPLIEVLGHDSYKVRMSAAWALGSIEDPRATDPLRRGLRDSDARVRATAADALGEIEAHAAAPDLEELVTADSDRRVRMAAIEALGDIELARSAPALSRVLDGNDVELAIAAAEAIGDLDDLRTAPAGLVRASRHTNTELRMAAIDGLARIEDPATADALMAAIDDSDPEIRIMVIEALGDMEIVSATRAITRALSDSDSAVRLAAVEALADIEDR